jgi:hypothetical protein
VRVASLQQVHSVERRVDDAFKPNQTKPNEILSHLSLCTEQREHSNEGSAVT